MVYRHVIIIIIKEKNIYCTFIKANKYIQPYIKRKKAGNIICNDQGLKVIELDELTIIRRS